VKKAPQEGTDRVEHHRRKGSLKLPKDSMICTRCTEGNLNKPSMNKGALDEWSRQRKGGKKAGAQTPGPGGTEVFSGKKGLESGVKNYQMVKKKGQSLEDEVKEVIVPRRQILVWEKGAAGI